MNTSFATLLPVLPPLLPSSGKRARLEDGFGEG